MADHMTAEQLQQIIDLARIEPRYDGERNRYIFDATSATPERQFPNLAYAENFILENIRQIAARLSGMAAVPADHVVVPREPTEEMIAAGCRQWDSTPADQHQIDCCRDTYRAMLAAAQEPPHV